jgi:multidrug efflux pump subunit AcrA (membrane-fusion protein)
MLWLCAAAGCRPPADGNPEPPATVAIKTVNVIRVVREENSSETATYFGTLQPVRRSQPRFQKPGIVSSLAPLGSRLAAGEQLGILEQDELQDRLDEIQTELQQLRQVGTDQLRIGQLEAADREVDQELAKGVITAPWDCLVTDRFLDEGSLASPQTPTLEIVETLPPRVEIRLPRRVADRLELDQLIWVVMDNRPVRFRVSYRSIEEKPAGSKTLRLTLQDELPNIPWAFGQTVEVRFNLSAGGSGFWLPLSALNRDASGLWSIYTVDSANTPDEQPASIDDSPRTAAIVQRKIVNIVQLENTWALVEGALGDNQQVVVNGAHRIVTGQRIQTNDVTDQYTRPGSAGEAG